MATVCAAAPLTSPACVTWAGRQTCPRPRPPQDPPRPAAPGTAAATSTATAAGGGLASVMSARVSGHIPTPGASSSFLSLPGLLGLLSQLWIPLSHCLLLTPNGFSATPHPGTWLFLPSLGPCLPSFEAARWGQAGQLSGPSCPCPDSVSHLLGPPQTGRGGSTANGAGLAALATPRARVAAGPASATGMGTRAAATVTTSAGSASVRTTPKVPTASSAPPATMGTLGEPGASQVGQGVVRDVVGQGKAGLTLFFPPSPQGWWLLFPGVWGACPPYQRVLSGAGLTPGWGAAASRRWGSENWARPVLLRVGCLSHRGAAALCPWDPLSPPHPHLLPRQQHPLHGECRGCRSSGPCFPHPA